MACSCMRSTARTWPLDSHTSNTHTQRVQHHHNAAHTHDSWTHDAMRHCRAAAKRRHGHDNAFIPNSPHDLVPFLHSIYEGRSCRVAPGHRLDAMPSPRILAVHEPLSSLPASVEASGCRVVYLCRDPKDAFVSLQHYLDEIKPEGSTMAPFDEAFELLCDGVSPYGPMWDHAAEYWKESLARPEEVVFLRYESLKEDGVGSVRRLAGFLGCPFTGEEVAGGVPEAIVELWSSFKNSAFFRKGEVGDWKEHMSPEMARRLDDVVEEKLRGSGLSLIRHRQY